MSGGNWTRPQVNEALVALYLRLNGYFTTGLVIHSEEKGENKTEIDCLAVRHKNHAQPDTGVSPAPFLHPRSDCIDLLICEVKSSSGGIAFNEKLRSEREVLEYVLRWAGVFPPEEIRSVADLLRPILEQGSRSGQAQDGVVSNGVRVRGLLSCPPAKDATEVPGWCLHGSEIFRYAVECFNPERRRFSCSTKYDLQLWGAWLAPIVKYFKALKKGHEPSLEELYLEVDAS